MVSCVSREMCIIVLSINKSHSKSKPSGGGCLAGFEIEHVRKGERGTNQKFIPGAIKAFPGYELDDFYYVDSEKSQNE